MSWVFLVIGFFLVVFGMMFLMTSLDRSERWYLRSTFGSLAMIIAGFLIWIGVLSDH